MLKGGVIMDVINVEQARIAEEAGAVAVMALERIPADVVWFSSALPRSQKDWFPFNHVHHMNEQHDAFWINLFHFFGFDHVRPVPHPSGTSGLSAQDDQALRQRGRLIFYNPEAVQVNPLRLLSFAKGSCKGRAATESSGGGKSPSVLGQRELCSQVLDVYGKDDEGKFGRWLNAWDSDHQRI